MERAEVNWSWKGTNIKIGLSRLGSGPEILLLPALSSISTREEMRPLQERLALASFSTVAVDWPGFGDQFRPRLDWCPEVHAAFLSYLVKEIAPSPFATVAAGHAASYALAQAAVSPGSVGQLCLIAPTWRGPLPTMMGKRYGSFATLARAVDLPVFGSLLYRLNVNRFVVNMMARGHVYSDPGWLHGDRLAEKLTVIAAPGARHASIRFVSGHLDPMLSRAAFLATVERVTDPVLVLYGAGTPPKSKAEMDALAALPHIRVVRLPIGKLAVHEEYPGMVSEAVKTFLRHDRMC